MSTKTRSSAAFSGQKPPPDKKKKPSPPMTEQASFSSLPDDLKLNCIARVSRLHYRTLSFVSKTLRSIVSSPELYETRALLNRTEKCLYICLHFSWVPNPVWFTLCRIPDRKITAAETSGYSMFEVPSPNHLLPAQGSSLVAVGSDIYRIGGSDSFELQPWKRLSNSTRVSVLDCRTHTWRKAPSMKMKRGSPATSSLVNGKIYVAGGTKDKNIQSRDWIEAFDPETQTWESLKNPQVFELHHEFRDKGFDVKGVGLEGKLYVAGDSMSVFDPEEGKWEWKEKWKMFWAVKACHCVIDDVLFYLVKHKGEFEWFDSKAKLFKKLHGVEGLPDMVNRKYVKMVDLGGKIGVLWHEVLFPENMGIIDDDFACEDRGEARVWCAVIELERRNDGDEIWGKVEWVDFVLRAHGSCSGFRAVTCTV